MFRCRVACPCGFASQDVLWGSDALGSTRVSVPVYLPSSGTLVGEWFDAGELGIPVEQIDRWVEDKGDAAIAARLGSDAIRLRSFDDRLPCPKCGRRTGAVVGTGIG